MQTGTFCQTDALDPISIDENEYRAVKTELFELAQ